jgi:hypothetical protein
MSNSIRYTVEHKVLPSELFNSGPALLYKMMSDPGQAMITLYKRASAEQPDSVLPFSPVQFSETHQEYYRGQDAILVVRVGMPAPAETLDCRAVYLCYSRKGSNNMLFSSVLGADGKFHLCAWDWNNLHINFGIAPGQAQDETDNVAAFYWEMMNNDVTNFIKAGAMLRK